MESLRWGWGSNKMKRKQRPSKRTKDTIVIVCGKTKTEVNYFNRFGPKIGRMGKIRVEVIGTGSNTAEPLAIVEKAVSLKNPNSSIAAVWAVFDKDDFDLGPAIHRAENNGISVAWSNQAFEIWFILHFEFFTREVNRAKYTDFLEKHLGSKYEKNDRSLFDKTFPMIENAIENAKKGHQQHIAYGHDPDNACSCTTVYKLVEELLKWIEE